MLKIFLYLVVYTSFFNVIMRSSIESNVTLFRLLAPVALFIIFLKKPNDIFLKFLLFFVFFVYSFFLAVSYSSDLSQFFPSVVHFLYLFSLYCVFWYLRILQRDRFEESVWLLMKSLIALIFIFILIEVIFDYNIPNLYVIEDGWAPAIRAFYWNQNDLAVVLCGFCWFLFFNQRVNAIAKLVVFLLFSAIILYNGSKSAFIALFLISFLSALNFVRLHIREYLLSLVIFFSISILVCISFAYAFIDYEFSTSQGTYTFRELISNPIARIVALESTGEMWGSTNNRVDATIFVLIEYFKTFGLGLGPGGSWLVLTFPMYELGGAKSPHNALLQFVVDFGFPVLIGYFYLVLRAVIILLKKHCYILDKIRSCAILTFPVLGLSQSGAIVTNYSFFVMVVFLVVARADRFESLFSKVNVDNERK